MYPDFCEIFGKDIYIVGGAVRDRLLGIDVVDIDIASAIHPYDFKDLSKSLGYKTFDTGIEHGTVTVLIDGKPYEHTTFRTDVSCDGRNANVSFSKTIEEDLSRRDFTINAIALLGKKIIDPFNGQNDLKNKILKTVGTAEERFSEDYLRIIRAARFASRLKMSIDTDLLIAAKELAPKITQHVSVERISDEFKKAQGHAEEFLKVLYSMNILDVLFDSTKDHYANELWWEEVGRAAQYDGETYFAALVRPSGDKNKVESICREYKLSRSIIRFSCQLVEHLAYFNTGEFSLEKSYQILKSCGDNSSRLLNYLHNVIEQTEPRPALEQTLNQLDDIDQAIKNPLINGGDLHTMNIKPGPEFRHILDRAALLQIEGLNKEEILNKIG
ncbi:putative poly(A) polymerase [Lentisphaera araneosa HTCC2155]|uniref:Putative poly(A) polymerase n=1 Tax=Lentisphaera araneosa HTCC2155 TaxID=313628 RepID=A6DP87_9BACT|nr:CCA tRNA nucleotidyltransferase [Lentisphaera araneosa]EDM26619.1 putative poly(A) polymerase [Lentisphaera araneosa HTCC2155]